MLSFEDGMYRDLKPIFHSNRSESINASFEDRLVQNTSVRVLTDNENNECIAYTFLDNTTLAITTNIDTLQILRSARVSAQTAR
jgi:hypothetical protein